MMESTSPRRFDSRSRPLNLTLNLNLIVVIVIVAFLLLLTITPIDAIERSARHHRISVNGVLQQEYPTVHVEHELEIIAPAHMAESVGEHQPTSNLFTRPGQATSLWEPSPWPYSHDEPPCTAYARQDNCIGDPPLGPDPFPPCGTFASARPNTTVFAIVGDYGLDGNCEQIVHTVVMKLQAQFGPLAFIMTTGDNAYWGGSCESLQSSVVRYYGDFLPNTSIPCTNPLKNPTKGYVNPHWTDTKHFRDDQAKLSHQLHRYEQQRAHAPWADLYADEPLNGPTHTAPLPRFFPTIGNHDWDTYQKDPLHMPYFQIFDYLMDFPPADVAHGQFYVVQPIPGVELYSLNSNIGSPSASPAEQDLFQDQVNWLKTSLRASTASFKFVYFHHPPFSTAQHDALAPWMDLDYEDWGATAVFSGHQHTYERLIRNKSRTNGAPPTIPYFVNGLGGHPWTYQIHDCPPFPGSQVRYNNQHGAQIVIQSWNATTQSEQLDLCFYSTENGGSIVDHINLQPKK